MMKKPFRRFALFILPVLALAGCVSTAPEPPLPKLTFSHLEPLNLKVAQIEIVNDYKAPLTAPFVEHTAPVAPAAAIRAWAEQRLTAGGGAGIARLVIRTASLKDVRLETTKGLKGAFTNDQADRFEAVVAVTLDVFEGGGTPAGSVKADSSRSRTVAEDASVNDRRRVQFELVEALIADIDGEMEKNIRAHLGRWLD